MLLNILISKKYLIMINIKQMKKDKKFLNILNEKIRTKMIDKLNNIVSSREYCIQIEDSCFEFTINYSITNNYYSEDIILSIYMHKLNDLYNNISRTNNIGNYYLPIMIISGKIDLTKIAYYKPEELFPDNWQDIIKHNEFIEDKKKNIATCKLKKPCKCGCIKGYHYQLQTRSSDEPMTNFVVCVDCGFVWKS